MESNLKTIQYFSLLCLCLCDFCAHLNGVGLCVSVANSNARLYTRRDWQIIEISKFDQIQMSVIEAALFSLHHTTEPARWASPSRWSCYQCCEYMYQYLTMLTRHVVTR